MGQGADHLGSSLAPATDQSLSAGASCASSLPAFAAVVTTRLAQSRCRFAQTALPQGSHWLGAIAIGRREDASCMSHKACLAHTCLAANSCCWLGQGSGAVPRTNVGEARSRPRRVCPGLRQNGGWRTLPGAVRTIGYRLTGISEPCGCRCRGDQSGSCARFREHRVMHLGHQPG